MSSRKEQKEQARQERVAAEQAAASAKTRGRRMKIIGAVVGGAAIVVIAAVLISLGGGSSDSTVEGGGEVEARLKGIPQDGITLGDPKAPVTLVEFADLKCPFCRDFSNNVFPTLVDDYIRDGKVKVVFRAQTFVAEQITPGDSRDAATMAEAAGLQDKMWNFVDLFYINQKPENERFATDEWLREIGAEIPGLDVEKAMSDRDNPEVDKQLTEASDAFTEAGFSGTPSFLVGKSGGELEELVYTDLEDPAEFKTEIDLLLAGD
ncbi:MAG: thioredoxin domain-containing protein [Actinobacteria bacterium]|nr:thioredoxin domain-containing protein [Actinomycetota bacterium]